MRPRRGVAALVDVLLRWLLPILVFGAIAARCWSLFGDFVTGVDPGNWLALGRGSFGGPGKSTAAGYPPLVPILLHIGRILTDPITAARLVGAGSVVAIVVVTYVGARHDLHRFFALTTAATVGLAGAVTELMILGGYPQHVAFAALICAAFATARFLAEGRRGQLVVAALGLALAALSHHMYFALAGVVVAVVWVMWATTGPPRRVVVRRTGAMAVAGAVAVLCFLPTYLALRRAGFDAPINAGGLGLETAFRLGIREAPWVWLPVFATGAAFVALTPSRRQAPTWQVAAALMSTAAALLAMTAEQRLLPPLVVGASLGMALALQDLWSRGRGTRWGGWPLAAAAAIPLLLVLAPRPTATTAALSRESRVVDRSLLSAAAFVDDHHEGRLVAVRQDRRALPIGWWFEGLTGAPIAVGSFEAALAFPEERENARLVDRFFAQELSSAAVARLGTETGVGLLVFGKWEWLGWARWLEEPAPAVEVVYDDGRFMIVDLDPDGGGGPPTAAPPPS